MGLTAGRKKTWRHDIQLNDTQHKGCICNTQHKHHSAQMTLSITAQAPLCRLSLCRILHSIYCCTECHYAEYHYAECHYAECHYAECHYAECRILFIGMLSVVMLVVIMLIVAAPKTWVSKQKIKVCLLQFYSSRKRRSFDCLSIFTVSANEAWTSNFSKRTKIT